MRYTVGTPSMQLLRRAMRFSQPEGDPPKDAPKDAPKDPPKDDPKPDPKKPDDKDPPTDAKQPVPFSRFSEVNKARRTAERSLATATAEVETLKTQLKQAQSGDQAAALKAVQDEVTALKASIQTIDDEFEDMLEVALTGLTKEQAEMVREIPGGARAQFAWFNKHRTRLVGDEAPTDKRKGPAGPKNERKPDGDEKPGPSNAAKQYVEARKPKEKGFAGLA